MSDSARLRHGLEPFLSSRTDQSGSDEGIRIEVQTDLGHINLRGDAANSEFLAAVATALQQDLPVAANTMTKGDHRVFWLGPNEWQIVTAADNTARLLAGLREALTDVHASMCDLSGGQVALRVTGSGVREVLAKGCTLDLSPAKFAVSGHLVRDVDNIFACQRSQIAVIAQGRQMCLPAPPVVRFQVGNKGVLPLR